MARIETHAPTTLAGLDLRPRGPVQPSPVDWRDQSLYFLLPDRFSDGREASRPLFNPAQPMEHRAADRKAWMDAGKGFTGGTINGITSKLDYLHDLGVTALWVGPVWKQRADLQTYHGYGIQNFLEVDPRFGTRRDLRRLVDEAHRRGIYIILDIIINHTGNNWFYDNNGHAWNSMPYRYEPPYPVHGWRSAEGKPIQQIESLEDGVWPREFQNLEWYTRAGAIESWDPAEWEDPLDPRNQFRRGDFFDLKDLNLEREDTLAAIVQVYQYWIAVTDCDGFRIDTVKHIPVDACRHFCGMIREYAESIGKDNFWLIGEVTGGEYMAKSYVELFGRDLDAVLDIGEARSLLTGMTKGFAAPAAFFDQFTPHDILGSHRETGRYHVSILDDHDMVGGTKARFAAGAGIPDAAEQAAHAVGVMLTTLGVPCIYYGTEQLFDGSAADHSFSIEPNLSFEDRYIREGMFGGAFGAYRTTGCHFFNPDHPSYQRIAAIARVRNRADTIGLALRRGRQYLYPTSVLDQPFRYPGAGEVLAWSRILFDTAVLVAMNTHGAQARGAWVLVNGNLHPPGTRLSVLYRGDWSPEQLKSPPRGEVLTVEVVQGHPAVRLDLPPAGMVILA
ncbi:MAG TPA: alpha-amylase family glycosyl hydrolase [Aggregatilineales bacterium]|nr:alpha-amylase family glycosyl hydrolase [Aggregatilineales bacterium]